MKRIELFGVLAVFLAVGLAAPAHAQQQQEPLGDYARSVRKEKSGEKPVPAARKFDNDNLPTDDSLSVVGPQPAPSDNPGQDSAAQPNSADKTAAPTVDAQKKEDAANKEWQKKIDAQKQQIDLLSRELNVLQGEFRLQAAKFYGDAGARLRNPGGWDNMQKQYQQQIDAKQKALDQAKKQLDDTQEQARKSGVPSSMRE